MYPTLAASVVLAVAAIHYARAPEAGRLRVVRNLQLLVLLVGTLGFVTGLIHAFTSLGALSAAEAGQIALVAIGEALCNVGLALVALVASQIATAIGAHRAAPSSGATLADPHRP